MSSRASPRSYLAAIDSWTPQVWLHPDSPIFSGDAFTAVLDASVLYPLPLPTRRSLPRLSCRPVLERADPRRGCPEPHHRQACTAARPTTARCVRGAFDAASVPHEAIARLEPAMTNEAKDRHVLATAVASDAQTIVTLNLKHFERRLQTVRSRAAASRRLPTRPLRPRPAGNLQRRRAPSRGARPTAHDHRRAPPTGSPRPFPPSPKRYGPSGPDRRPVPIRPMG